MTSNTQSNCFICKEVIDDKEISCKDCGSKFHQSCLKINDNLDVWTCPSCNKGVLNVPSAPKSVRSATHSRFSRRSSVSKASASSSKAELLMKALDDKKAMLAQQHKEQELLLQQKHAREQELMNEKIQVLQETINGGSIKSSSKSGGSQLSKVPSISSKEKVQSWVASNAVHSTQVNISDNQIDDKLDDLLEHTKPQSNAQPSSSIVVQSSNPTTQPQNTTETQPQNSFVFQPPKSTVDQPSATLGQPVNTIVSQSAKPPTTTVVQPQSTATTYQSSTTFTPPTNTVIQQPLMTPMVQPPQARTFTQTTTTIVTPPTFSGHLTASGTTFAQQQNSTFNVPQPTVSLPHHASNTYSQSQIQQPLGGHVPTIPAPVNSGTHYLSYSRPKPDATNYTSLTKEQIAARHVTKDLPKFDGQPKDWPKFLSSYYRSTEMCGFSNSENMERLERSLKGSALAAVESSLRLDDNLPRVLEILEMLFGKPEYILDSLLDAMRSNKKPSMESIDSIISYALEVEGISTTMKLAKLSEHLWNPMLLKEMVNRLPMKLMLEWAEAIRPFNQGGINIEVFSSWLREKSMTYASVLIKPPNLVRPSSSKTNEKSKGFVNIHEKTESSFCCVCDSGCNAVELCEKFKGLNYSEKWNTVKNNGLCRTCLRKHWGRCRKNKPCGVNDCKAFHHDLLHKPPEDNLSDDANENRVNAHLNVHQACFFKVIPVVLKHGSNSVNTFAMLDDCSSLTLVSQGLAEKLGATGPKQELCLKWTSNIERVERDSQKLNLQISGVDVFNTVSHKIQCRTVENLNLPKQTLVYDTLCQKYDHLKGLPIKSYESAEVGILIGINNANLLLTKSYRTGNDDQLIAARTKLGWIVFGSNAENSGNVFHVHECVCVVPDEKIDDLMKENYAIETLGISSKSSSLVPTDDQRSYEIWKKTTKFEDSHYEIGLLFKYDQFKLPNNFEMAKRRMQCLLKKCDREQGLRDVINCQINDYLRKGYARRVPPEELKSYNGNLWYLPIFIVKNPNKPSKIRLVWDAAAMVRETSLNSVLLKGPDLLSTLFGVLLRFRQFRVAVSGDIQEMFHQIRIRREDQRFQLFLWTDEHGNLVTYAMVGMTFGASCSPSSAQYIKNLNAETFREQFPRAVESVCSNHYVDDLLDSVETEPEAIQLAKEVYEIHKHGGFHIRNWISNAPNVSRILNSCEDGKSLQMFADNPIEKILGMWWQTSSDNFTYSLRFQKTSEAVWKGEKRPTKREVLKAVMSIYDPLGLLSHILIFPKILLQNVWKDATDWDDEINAELAIEWKRWTSVLHKIEQLQIPRWFGYSSQVRDPELHVFTDASKEAYSAVAYIRFKRADSDDFHVALISAKARVAPLKYMSVPRLELMGALIGIRLAESIKNSLTIKIRRQVLWTDSTCVLGWINSDHRKYKPYVAARIGEILESSTTSDWRYIPTSMNIADEATRMKLSDISSESIWFQGPPFLLQDESSWPHVYKKEKQVDEEILAQYVGEVNIHHAEIAVENISTWTKLRRVQVFVHRYLKNLKLKLEGKDLLVGDLMTAKELREAEFTLFRQAQEQGYPEEVAILSGNGSNSIPKSSSVYKDAPYLDEFGVMRACGRIDSITGVPFRTKRPVILPKDHSITTIIMDYFHKSFHHHNSETVINELRQRYVIPAMRVKLKSIKNSCQWCKNKSARPGTVMMSGLPEARLTSFAPAFTCIGLDYFGPMFVAVRRSREKRWGILITCLTTRAVHLEVAYSLNTDSCILGLRRFMCRRGTPKTIYSDNATNFKCANKVLKEAIRNVDEKAVALHFTTPDTEWCFIPPASPHMGGAWERMVRSVKTTINAMFPMRFTPNDEMLLSVLLEAENIINSRPLTYVPLEDDEDEALTPNHFILGSSNGLKSLGDFQEGSFDLRNSWKQSQAYGNFIWQKWIRTILPDLRRREKWLSDSKPLEVDDIVLVVDDTAPRNCYKKGRVIGVNPGHDGKVRSVTVQTIDGIYVRPITKLAVLDVHRKCTDALTVDDGNVGDDSQGSIPSSDQGILGGSVEKTPDTTNSQAITSAHRHPGTPTQRELRNLPHRIHARRETNTK